MFRKKNFMNPIQQFIDEERQMRKADDARKERDEAQRNKKPTPK